MNKLSAKSRKNTVHYRLLLAFLVLSILSSCTLPKLPWQRTPPQATAEIKQQPTSTPTEKPRPVLPPAIIETSPEAGSELALAGEFSIVFSEPMDRQSVEAAVSVEPATGGSFTWQDDGTVAFVPDQPLAPGTDVKVTVNTTARAANGLALTAPREISFQAAGLLEITQRLPEPDGVEIDPTSAVVLAFNRPVVALGANSEDLPQAFTLEPGTAGRGEWINTSTYIFYPSPSLGGGVTYTAQVNAELRGVNGEPFLDLARSDSPAGSWSFTTALPAASQVLPDYTESLSIHPELVVVFNQPMDTASVENAFSFTPLGGNPEPGEFTWEENNTQLKFKPTFELSRETTYTLVVAASARSAGGAGMAAPISVTYMTVSPLRVVATLPANGGILDAWSGYGNLQITFSAPVITSGITDRILVTPKVPGLTNWSDKNTLFLGGYYQPGQTYTVSVPADLLDIWGYRIQEPYTFSFQAGRAAPQLSLGISAFGGSEFVINPGDLTLPAQATNLTSLTISRRDLSLEEFIRMSTDGVQPLSGKRWTQAFSLPENISQEIEISLDPQDAPLANGFYLLDASSAELKDQQNRSALLAVSPLVVLLKKAPEEALVWAVVRATGEPAGSIPVTLYDSSGTVIASGETDSSGLFQSEITAQPEENSWKPIYAITGSPGEANFGVAASDWSEGFNGWDFGFSTTNRPSGLRTYLYTDKPIYQPGQVVNFKAVVRFADNGRYSLPDIFHLPVQISGYSPTTYEPVVLDEQDLQLSEFGTGSGSYTLPADLPPGYYELHAQDQPAYSKYFQVAEYRKPEIELSVETSIADVLEGDKLQGLVQADYYFGAPANGLAFNWTLYEQNDWFALPDAVVGPVNTDWLEPAWMHFTGSMGQPIASGSGITGGDGSALIDLPTSGEPSPQKGATRRLTLEVTASDESGFSVSDRAETVVHPEKFYLGIDADSWNGRAGDALGFLIKSAGWNQEPVNLNGVQAEFQKVEWKEVPPEPGAVAPYPVYQPVYTPVASTTFNTDASGQARLSFTPPDPGTYQLDVSVGDALTQTILWVSGSQSAAWPSLPSRLQLTADKASYLPGETARLFIPNPYGTKATALVTRERSRISEVRILTIDAGGSLVDLPLSGDDSPNIYISVTLLGGKGKDADFNQGYANLVVDPVEQTLNVQLLSQPEQTGPGDELTLTLKVTDSNGKPVKGEFSLALVDLAALALAESQSTPITEFFYGNQPLGISTGLSLAVAPRRKNEVIGGVGGGGGDGAAASVRQDFKDTAYWNPQVVTGEDGVATVTVHLPDNLTTWKADARGLTAASQVGQAELEVITSLPLLIRPVTPRFTVQGDHMSLGAVVNNNTGETIDASVTLESPGFRLDNPQQASQQVSIPAGGRVRLDWPGTVTGVDSLDLLFRVQGGGRVDAARPEINPIPVLKYISSQTFSTAGVLSEPGEVTEIIGLPRSFVPEGGQLEVNLSPSLAAAILRSLEVVEEPEFETPAAILSAFLPNLQTYRLLSAAGIEQTDLKTKLDASVRRGVAQLVTRQKTDGGWGWSTGSESSDTYLSAYILFGLVQASQSGYTVSSDAIDKAVSFLKGSLDTKTSQEKWQLNRMAFMAFALASAGESVPDSLSGLYSQRELLDPWAQALLALSIQAQSPDDARSRTLVSDLQGTAVRSATGVHWESQDKTWINPGNPVQTSALVVYALASLDPASDLLPGALRYLSSHQGANFLWGSDFETAWVLMAFGQTLKGTGELQAAFDYAASLNEIPIAEGQAQGAQLLEGVQADIALEDLYQDSGNSLTIKHGQGNGRLYYGAHLMLNRPAEDAPAVSKGITVTRDYFLAGQDCRKVTCTPLESVSLDSANGGLITVRLSVTLAEDMYYLIVEDAFPSGVEMIDLSLQTSQQGVAPSLDSLPATDASDPFADGWGWWYFGSPRVYDDHIAWSAEYLPAGTYQLVYTVQPVFTGEFQVLPARAWEYFFPEVQGTSAGSKFSIDP